MENIKPQGQRRDNGILQLKHCVRGGGAGSKPRSALLAGLRHMCQVRGLCWSCKWGAGPGLVASKPHPQGLYPRSQLKGEGHQRPGAQLSLTFSAFSFPLRSWGECLWVSRSFTWVRSNRTSPEGVRWPADLAAAYPPPRPTQGPPSLTPPVLLGCKYIPEVSLMHPWV